MALTSIAWVGRLTGPKGEIAMRLIRDVAPKFPDISFTIVGGPVTDVYRNVLGSNVSLTGFIDDVEKVFAETELIIGAGRVPVEAMRYGRPVIAVGENRYIGPIDEDTIDDAKASNFGDCEQFEEWDVERLIKDIQAISEGDKVFPLDAYQGFVKDYNIDVVYPQVCSVYRNAVIDNYLRRFKEIPILTYHRVLKEKPANSKFNIYVTVEELESQIKSLIKRGFEFLTFKDIANGVEAEKPIVLTFDDGYEDNYLNLLPLLRRYNAKAVIYALGDRAITNNYWDMELGEAEAALMNDEHLLACHASGLVEIGAHGLSHRRLSELSDEASRREIFSSKDNLESLLQDEVVSFAYPYGDYSEREASFVREAGYLFGIATVSGPVSCSDDLMRVRRITMFPNTSSSKFWKKTSGWYLRYCRLKGKDF